jgi:hypothetical protein
MLLIMRWAAYDACQGLVLPSLMKYEVFRRIVDIDYYFYGINYMLLLLCISSWYHKIILM